MAKEIALIYKTRLIIKYTENKPKGLLYKTPIRQHNSLVILFLQTYVVQSFHVMSLIPSRIRHFDDNLFHEKINKTTTLTTSEKGRMNRGGAD